MDQFTSAYITCALWSSTDNSRDDGGDPLDANYDGSDLAPQALEAIRRECAEFQECHAEDLALAYEKPGYTEASAGHDFWLTRNGHGAGFWDRGLDAVGDRLSDACKPYGSVDLYRRA